MTQGDNFNETVRIHYDVSQPLEEISKLLTRIGELDTKLETSGTSSGVRFSTGFRAGMQGTFDTLTEIEVRLAKVFSNIATAQAGSDFRPAAESVPAYRWPAGTPGGLGGTFMSKQDVINQRGTGVGGGGGAFDYDPGDFGPGSDYRTQNYLSQLRQRQMANWFEAGGGRGRQLGYGMSNNLDPAGFYDAQPGQTQLPLPGMGMSPIFSQPPVLGQQRLPGFYGGMNGFPMSYAGATTPVGFDHQQNRRLGDLMADMDEQIETAMMEEVMRRRQLAIAQQNYGHNFRINQLSRPDMMGVMRTQAGQDWQSIVSEAQNRSWSMTPNGQPIGGPIGVLRSQYDQMAFQSNIDQLRGTGASDYARSQWYAGIPAGQPISGPIGALRSQYDQLAFQSNIDQLRMQAGGQSSADAARDRWLAGIPAGQPIGGAIGTLRQQIASQSFQDSLSDLRRQTQEANPDFGGYPVGQPVGLFSRRLMESQNISRLQSQMETAGAQKNFPEYDRLGKQLHEAQARYKALGDEIDGPFKDKFFRHLTWIAQGIAIWGALNLATQAISAFITEMLRMESVQVRLNFITGQGAGTTADQFQQAATYGLTPAIAGPGLVTSAQLNLSPQQTRQGQEIAQVFPGEDLTNIYQELYQTQERAAAAGLKYVNVQDYLATAQATVSGNLETYLDALQYGIEYHRLLGMSAEEAGLAIGELANKLDTSPDAVRTLLGRVRVQLDKPAVREELEEKFGIVGPTYAEYYQQISAGVAAGGPQAEQIIASVAKGLQGAQQISEFRVLFVGLNDDIANGSTKLREFGDIQTAVADTGEAAINRLKASWVAMLGTFGNTGLAKGALGGATEFMDTTSRFFQNSGQLASQFGDPRTGAIRGTAMGILSDPMQFLEALGKARQQSEEDINGLGNLGYVTDWRVYFNIFADAVLTFEGAANDIGHRRQGTAGRLGDEDPRDEELYPGGPGTGAGDMLSRRMLRRDSSKADPIGFGGFNTFPKGADWDKFVSRVGEFETKLATVPGYEIDKKTVAFYDETTGFYRMLTADQEAIQRALAEQTDTLKQISGIFNVPAGGEILVPFAALQAGFVPDSALSSGGAGVGGGGSVSGLGKGGSPYIMRADRLQRQSDADREDILLKRRTVDSKNDPLAGAEAHVVGPGARRPNTAKAGQTGSAPGMPAINISMRNVVMLNGRIIQDEISKMLRRAQASTNSSSASGAGGNQLLG